MPTFLRPQPKPIPDIQGAYLRYVRDFLVQYKVSPSLGEMAAASGDARSSVRKAINGLIRHGYLERGPGYSRNLMITPSGHGALRAQQRRKP